MTLRTDSYGSVAEVMAYTRHLLDGASAFDTNTRPTLAEVEKFIDRASGTLNVALRTFGFSTPVTNTTAVLLLSDWTVMKAAEYVEVTQRGVGFSGEEGSRRLVKIPDANEFVQKNSLGLKRLGLTVSQQASDGLQFTGLDARHDRSDPSDASLEQPKFRRSLFNAAVDDTTSDFAGEEDE
jgi:hypothetical protein